jgi:hypothetical protein
MRALDEPLIKASDHPVLKSFSLPLPNPKAPNEPMLGLSVHPTIAFEKSSCRTHPTNVEKQAPVHPTLCFEF